MNWKETSMLRLAGSAACGLSLALGSPAAAVGIGVLTICQAVDIATERVIAALAPPMPAKAEERER